MIHVLRIQIRNACSHRPGDVIVVENIKETQDLQNRASSSRIKSS
jgi:hypothetical protein